MKAKRKGRSWGIWIVLILVAAILAVLPMLAAKNEIPTGVQTVTRSAQAQTRQMDTILLGGGQLSSSGISYVKIPEEIKIREFLVHNGDTVLEGDPVALIDPVSVMTAITQVQDTLQELAEQINAESTASGSSTVTAKPGGRVKAVYGSEGESVEDVMLRCGALAVLSLDDTMAVKIKAETTLSTGDKVSVSIGDDSVLGRVSANVSGELTVTVEDQQYEIGTQAVVSTLEGQLLGSGPLTVANAWNVTAYSGTISKVHVKPEQKVSANQTLFTLTESGKSAEYQRLIDKRQKYEELMQELFTMYRSRVLTAPCKGIVSGIDTEGTYMLCGGEEGIQLRFLSNVSFPVSIETTSLVSGQVGVAYTDFLRATEDAVGTWEATGLPEGLTLDSESGLISGTPTVSGSFPISVSFKPDEENICTAELTITIAPAAPEPPPQYDGYLARVTIAGGNVIRVMQTEYSFTISDPEQLPNASVDSADMTVEATYDGQAIVDGNFEEGDFLWIILDAQGNLVNAQKISNGSQTPENPSGGNGGQNSGGIPSDGQISGGMPSGSFGGISGSFGGFAGGFGGMSGGFGGATTQVDDGLYSLNKLKVATITSQEKMTVSISIDELDITKVFVGQTAQITMNAYPEAPVEAVVRRIANSGENSGGNSKFTVELELQKSSRMLPGMNATATITLSTVENALCIPASAVYELDGQTVVYTSCNEKTKTPENPVPVTIGCADAEDVQILSGLNPGQTVYYEVLETGSAFL